MMRVLFLISTLILMGCAGKKNILQQTPTAQAPSWVTDKPLSSYDYIGVGRASVRFTDYAFTAKRMALADLASEIEVRVDAQSVLYTLEHDDRFLEQYTETVFLDTDLDLSGFEPTDSWTDGEEYWVMYRLNKQDYALFKEENKRTALRVAEAHFESSLTAYDKGDPSRSAEQALYTLKVLKPYWAEVSSTVDHQHIGLKALQQLDRIKNSMDLGLERNSFILSEENGFRDQIRFQLTLGGKEMVTHPLTLIQNGVEHSLIGPKAHFDLKPTKGKTITLDVVFDPFEQLRERTDEFDRGILQRMLHEHREQIKVQTELPTISLDVNHEVNGVRVGENYHSVDDKVTKALIDAGWTVSQSSGERYRISVRTETRYGVEFMGQFSAYTTGILALEDSQESNTLVQLMTDEAKGVHLDPFRAGRKSMDKWEQTIDKKLLEALMGGLF